MDKNIIKKLRQQAEEEWIKHFNFCSDKNVWNILNASLYDIHIMGMSWKLKWIDEQLNKLTKEETQND